MPFRATQRLNPVVCNFLPKQNGGEVLNQHEESASNMPTVLTSSFIPTSEKIFCSAPAAPLTAWLNTNPCKICAHYRQMSQGQTQ